MAVSGAYRIQITTVVVFVLGIGKIEVGLEMDCVQKRKEISRYKTANNYSNGTQRK